MEEKFELNKEMIAKMLSEKEMKFTYEEIEALMDAELEKEPEEMDIELVKMCSKVLADKYNPADGEEPSPAKTMVFPEEASAQAVQPLPKRKVKAGKILLIAAVIVLLCAVAIPVGARFLPSEAADKIVDFYCDRFKIDLRGDEPTTVSAGESGDLVNSLVLSSLDTLKLPSVLLSDEYEKNVRTQQSDTASIIYVDIDSSVSEASGNIMIAQYKDEKVELHNGVGNVSSMYKYFKQLNVADTDVLVFGKDGEIYIKYIDNNIEYEIILLKIDFDTALSIAESIN